MLLSQEHMHHHNVAYIVHTSILLIHVYSILKTIHSNLMLIILNIVDAARIRNACTWIGARFRWVRGFVGKYVKT